MMVTMLQSTNQVKTFSGKRAIVSGVCAGILCVNVESEPELALVSAVAAGKGRRADISLRVNPQHRRPAVLWSQDHRTGVVIRLSWSAL
jgi:diaminopimelate decarboxylase